MKIEVTEEYILGALIIEAQKRFMNYNIKMQVHLEGTVSVVVQRGGVVRKSAEAPTLAAALQRLLTPCELG